MLLKSCFVQLPSAEAEPHGEGVSLSSADAAPHGDGTRKQSISDQLLHLRYLAGAYRSRVSVAICVLLLIILTVANPAPVAHSLEGVSVLLHETPVAILPEPSPQPFPPHVESMALPKHLAPLFTLGCHGCHDCRETDHLQTRIDTKRRINAAYDDLCGNDDTAELAASRNCSRFERALVIVMAMIEDDKMTSSDQSKGDANPSANFSPWNMNADALNRLGCDLACAQELGQARDQWDVHRALRYLLRGLRGTEAIGSACDFLNFHRGGWTGWQHVLSMKGHVCSTDCEPYGCRGYKDSVVDGTSRMLADPEYIDDGRRVCEDLDHV